MLSLVVYQTLPTIRGTIGVVLTLGGSTLMVYADEKREETPEPRVPSAPLTGPWAPLSGGPDHTRPARVPA
ncbi:hypothetical protein ACFY0P_29030 [Streptomyces sp. NPDC001714]|uniref:hypothetical protein n=1 Tax=Streptomyces sp. NPDC001714 TaxID=3364603 RepID=UPI0036B8EE90